MSNENTSNSEKPVKEINEEYNYVSLDLILRTIGKMFPT